MQCYAMIAFLINLVFLRIRLCTWMQVDVDVDVDGASSPCWVEESVEVVGAVVVERH